MKYTVACECGNGLCAKAAKDAGMDFIVVSYTAYRRNHGYDAENAGRYSDSINEIVCDQVRHIVKVCGKMPVYAGVNVYNDMENVDEILEILKLYGCTGVVNAPEAVGTEWQDCEKESKMLKMAAKKGFSTIKIITNTGETEKKETADIRTMAYLKEEFSSKKVKEILKECELDGVIITEALDSQAIRKGFFKEVGNENE